MVDLSEGEENIAVLASKSIQSSTKSNGFRYSAFNTKGPGCPQDPDLICFEGCSCTSSTCAGNTCSCNLSHYEKDRLASVACESHRIPVYECNSMCKCGDECANRLVQRGVHVKLEVFASDNKGLGVQALENIKSGTFVCEYAGEVLGQKEATQRTLSQKEKDMNYIITVHEFHHNNSGSRLNCTTYIDPRHVGNVGRFINHSCDPSLVMVPVRVDSTVPHLALFALRDIHKGEELSFDYGGHVARDDTIASKSNKNSVNFGETDSDKTRKTCKCGSERCRGFLPLDTTSLDPV